MGGTRTRVIVAALATALLAGIGGSARGDFATIERFADGGQPMVPGPDGRLWLLGSRWPAGLEARADELRVALVPGADVWIASDLAPLADGSMAYVGQIDSRRRVLVRVRPGSQPVVTPLPETTGYGPAAIAADGAVWIDDLCGRRLLRIAPDGRQARTPVPAGDCERESEAYPMLAVGGDGAVWVAHLCAGRVVRVPLVGRSRGWRVPRRDDFCSVLSAGVRPLHVQLVPTPSGALRFPGGMIDARGRVRSRPWQLFPDRLASTAGPDGRTWYVRARYSWFPYEEHGWNVRLGARAADGAGEEETLPPFSAVEDEGTVLSAYPSMTAGPDGSVWIRAPERANGAYAIELIRATLVPPLGPAPVLPPLPTVRLLARSGARVWLQLACDARPGTYCPGDVGLAAPWGRVAAHRARLPIPGGQARALPLRLTARALERLGRRHRLDVSAEVYDRGGGVVTRPIHIR